MACPDAHQGLRRLEHASFAETYERRLLERLPKRRPLPLTYRRLLLWATLDDDS